MRSQGTPKRTGGIIYHIYIYLGRPRDPQGCAGGLGYVAENEWLARLFQLQLQ